MSSRLLPRLLVAALCFGGTAQAYVLKQTAEGRPVRWAQMPVTWRLSSAGARDLASGPMGEAVRASFQAWTAVPGAYVGLQAGGNTRTAVGFVPRGANENVVSFSREAWPFEPDAMAMTITAYQQSTGLLVDADILVNEQQYTWGIGAEVENDLQNALTHEVGHFLGLAHSDRETATMFAEAQPFEISKRTLDADDMAGVQALYPKGSRSISQGKPTRAIAQKPQAAQGALSDTEPQQPRIHIRTGCTQGRGPAPSPVWLLAALPVVLRCRRRVRP